MKLFAITLLVALGSMGFTGTASAAVTCVHPDHAVYGNEQNLKEITSCLTKNAWDISMSYAADLQKNGYHMKPGESIVLKDGRIEHCYFWYWSGCQLDRTYMR